MSMYEKKRELIGKNVRIVFKSNAATSSEGFLKDYKNGVLSLVENINFYSLKDEESRWKKVINYIDGLDILSICEIPSEAKSPSYKNMLNTFCEIEKELGFILEESGDITITTTSPIDLVSNGSICITRNVKK